MNRVIAISLGLLTLGVADGSAQQLLSLDSCRAMALRNNKQLGAARMKQDVALNLKKAARTKYLPHVSAMGGYVHTNREVSLLSHEQKDKLTNLGTTAAGSLQQGLADVAQQLPMGQVSALLGQMGVSLDGLQQLTGQGLQQFATALNSQGQQLVDALRTDTRNMWVGSVMVTQPVFMGGSIVAMNKMASLSEEMAANGLSAQSQLTLYNTDKAYWTVVSLKHKKRLAESYLELVRKLDGDVQKMIEQGVATRSDGLSVNVKVNEAEMTLQRVDDGLVLSKMLLCQMIGLPMDEPITLADEVAEDLPAMAVQPQPSIDVAMENRPELRMLSNTVGMSQQITNIMRAGHLPQVALVGGYAVSNPNVFNSFERKFGGVWNVGVLVRVPIWNWGDVTYKVRASKAATAIATLELDEAREKIELQVSQSTFKVDEANKRLAMAEASIRKADENLRTANLGFREGVITPTTVMEAQTAWLQAQSQKIDAAIDVRLSQVDLEKALGTLQ